jgi:NADPH:quinone reductase-like Zn-dependent oxidoreductase
MPFFHPIALMNTNKSVFGVNLGHMWHESGMIAAWTETLLNGVTEGWVRPHVDKSFPLEKAGDAHAYIEERRNTGKVVLTT